jgi:hypothetical protein
MHGESSLAKRQLVSAPAGRFESGPIKAKVIVDGISKSFPT